MAERRCPRCNDRFYAGPLAPHVITRILQCTCCWGLLIDEHDKPLTALDAEQLYGLIDERRAKRVPEAEHRFMKSRGDLVD